MSYREKTAWLSLLAMALTFGPYFALVSANPYMIGASRDPRGLLPFVIAAIARMLILGLGYILLRRQSPQEASAPADERDRDIMHRSMDSAYYVLMVGMILVGCVMPFNSGGWSIVNAALALIVAAETVRYGVMVFRYRRQA